MKSQGKAFEENFRKSVPSGVWYYRFRDSSNTFYGGNTELRFTPSNIADNMLYYNGKLFLNELKSHKGKSIPLDCIEGNKTKEKQIKELLEAQVFYGIESNVIIFFSEIERCFALNIVNYEEFKRKEERKSIPIEYFIENGIELEVSKKRTNYNYNLSKLLNK